MQVKFPHNKKASCCYWHWTEQSSHKVSHIQQQCWNLKQKLTVAIEVPCC